MNILALDLSLNQPGWAYKSGDEVKWGHHKSDTKKSPYERIWANLEWILDIVDGKSIDLVVFEKSIFTKGTSWRILSEQQGVIKSDLIRRNIPVAEVDISAWKKHITGKGNACLLYTSPSPRDGLLSRMPSSA